MLGNLLTLTQIFTYVYMILFLLMSHKIFTYVSQITGKLYN